MKVMKVFSCQDMPSNIKYNFFEIVKDMGRACNDTYVDWEVGEDLYLDGRDVEKWLIDNGANDGETVIIKHWW